MLDNKQDPITGQIQNKLQFPCINQIEITPETARNILLPLHQVFCVAETAQTIANSTKSKFNLVNYFKEEGNSNFKEKQYHQSLEYYQNCLSFLDCLYFDEAINLTDDDKKEEDNDDKNIPNITSTILSNLSLTHLRIHSSNPDLYSHLISALNCAQISLQLNPSNAKSIVRRVIALYRLGLYEFAESVFNENMEKNTDLKTSINLIEKEKKKVENNSVKYNVDRYIHEIINGGNFNNTKEDVDIEKNVFVRLAGAELIRQNKYKFEDFMDKYFSKNANSLQAVTMIAIFLNWDYKKLTFNFMKYLKIYLGKDSISFNKTKEIIKKCIKFEDELWRTDQAWKVIIKLLIVDRHEIEWCDILNCSDHGVLNKIYDKYKHRLVNNNKGIKFKKKLNDKSDALYDNIKYIQTEINELKRVHEIDKQHIFNLNKSLEKSQKKYDKLKERIEALETKDDAKKEIDTLNTKIFYLQVALPVFVVILAILVVILR